MARFAHGRNPFAEETKRTARRRGKERSSTLEFWFRRKFNLAPTDPRFLDITADELAVEYHAWDSFERPVAEEFEDDEFDRDAILRDMETNPGNWEDVTGQ
jgi:hypothetical protein